MVQVKSKQPSLFRIISIIKSYKVLCVSWMNIMHTINLSLISHWSSQWGDETEKLKLATVGDTLNKFRSVYGPVDEKQILMWNSYCAKPASYHDVSIMFILDIKSIFPYHHWWRNVLCYLTSLFFFHPNMIKNLYFNAWSKMHFNYV